MAHHDSFRTVRETMVQFVQEMGGIHNTRVLNSMKSVPRHDFVPKRHRHRAYHHVPLPIGERQQMLAPIVTAIMLESLSLTGIEHVLEVGTGSGYQTALLTQLCDYTFSLENSPLLADSAAERLHRMGYKNFDIHLGDGSQGLADMAPFDAIVVTAAVPRLPRPLGAQLHPDGGRMVIPVGTKKAQELQLVVRYGDQWRVQTLRPMQTRPLVGRYGFRRGRSADV